MVVEAQERPQGKGEVPILLPDQVRRRILCFSSHYAADLLLRGIHHVPPRSGQHVQGGIASQAEAGHSKGRGEAQISIGIGKIRQGYR